MKVEIELMDIWKAKEVFEVSEEEMAAIKNGNLPEHINSALRSNLSSCDDNWNFTAL